MRNKVNSVVVLVVGLAAFGTPTAVSGRSHAAVVKLSASTNGRSTEYLPGLARQHFPIPAPQDIGPVCPPGMSCANE
jgi:hypothetical protein